MSTDRNAEVQEWLAYRGLPATASLKDLIEHERENAALAAVFTEMKQQRDEVERLSADLATIQEVARGNKRHVAWLTAILEAVEKCADGYKQIDGGTEKVKVYAADVAAKIRAALTAEPDEARGEHTPTHTTQRPRIVVLCGSTRFRAEIADANRRLTLAGYIVLAPGAFGHDGDEITDAQKEALDDLHFRKIDLADEVYVVNPGGYIGESTLLEMSYARRTGKPVRRLVEASESRG